MHVNASKRPQFLNCNKDFLNFTYAERAEPTLQDGSLWQKLLGLGAELSSKLFAFGISLLSPANLDEQDWGVVKLLRDQRRLNSLPCLIYFSFTSFYIT